MSHQANRVLTGIALKVGAVFVFTLMLAISKAYKDYPLAVIIFYRSFFALLVLIVWLAWRGKFPRAIYTQRLPAHLVRAIAGIGSMFFMFAAYTLLPLADATALSYVQPLLVALFAGIVLGEKLTALRIGAIVCGFGGVLVMLWHHLGSSAPANGDHVLGSILSISGAVLVAVAFIQIRRLTETEDSGRHYLLLPVYDIAGGDRRAAGGAGVAVELSLCRMGAGAGLALAGRCRCAAADHDRHIRRHRPDHADGGLPFRPGLGAGGVRLFRAHLGGGHRLCRVCRDADGQCAGRGGHRHRGRAVGGVAGGAGATIRGTKIR